MESAEESAEEIAEKKIQSVEKIGDEKKSPIATGDSVAVIPRFLDPWPGEEMASFRMERGASSLLIEFF